MVFGKSDKVRIRDEAAKAASVQRRLQMLDNAHDVATVSDKPLGFTQVCNAWPTVTLCKPQASPARGRTFNPVSVTGPGANKGRVDEATANGAGFAIVSAGSVADPDQMDRLAYAKGAGVIVRQPTIWRKA